MLYYKEAGNKKGKLVIFVHGGFTTSESFMKQYKLLENYRCIFIDLPNHGQSICDKNYHYTFDDAAQNVIELADILAPKQKFTLISHSYGGLIVKLIIEKIPHRIERIVIGSTNIQKTLLFWLYTRKIGCIILWLQNRKRYYKDNISFKLVCDAQEDAWKNFNPPKTENVLTIPTLLLYAEYDIKEIKESMILWQQYFTNFKLLMIEETGHNYFFDCPDRINPIISEFIEHSL